jgi:hypothetical protein
MPSKKPLRPTPSVADATIAERRAELSVIVALLDLPGRNRTGQARFRPNG